MALTPSTELLLPGNWTRAVEPFVFQNGGDVSSPDGTKTSGYLDSPATVEAIQYYVDLYNKYHVSPARPTWAPPSRVLTCSRPGKQL